MKIILVRHGESEANIAHVINDIPAHIVNLTEKGRAQAATAGEQLRGQRFSHAYVSEFPRARQTAAILLRHHGCELRIDARLNERRSGMDGLPVNTFNDLVRPDPVRIKPEGGESFLELMERVRGFLDELAIRHPEAAVLAVSHENPILAALALRAGDPTRFAGGSIANCEWVELDWPTGFVNTAISPQRHRDTETQSKNRKMPCFAGAPARWSASLWQLVKGSLFSVPLW